MFAFPGRLLSLVFTHRLIIYINNNVIYNYIPFWTDFDFVNPRTSDIEKLNHMASSTGSSISVPFTTLNITSGGSSSLNSASCLGKLTE